MKTSKSNNDIEQAVALIAASRQLQYNEHNNNVDGLRYLQFNDLFDYIVQHVSIPSQHYGRKPIDNAIQCMTFIKKLSLGRATRDLSTRFGVSIGAVNNIFHNVIAKANQEQVSATHAHYLHAYGIPRCIGAIDGSYYH